MHYLFDWLTTVGAAEAALCAAVIAAVATTVAALLSFWGTIRRDKLLAAKRSQQLEHANKRLTFWNEWLKGMKPLGTVPEQEHWEQVAKVNLLAASHEMEAITAAYDRRVSKHREYVAKSQEDQKRIARLPKWRRLFLLYVPFGSVSLVFRTAFYLILAGTLWWATSLRTMQRNSTSGDRHSLEYLRSDSNLPVDEKVELIHVLTGQIRDQERTTITGWIFGLVLLGSMALAFRKTVVTNENTKIEFNE